MVRPAKLPPKQSTILSTSTRFCRSLTVWTACAILVSEPASSAMCVKARTSFGKQEPP